MSRGMRVVFDTGALVSAALRPSSPAERAFSLTVRRGVICASEATLGRLHKVLAGVRFDGYLTRRARTAFAQFVSRNAWLCPVFPAEISRFRPGFRDRRTNAVLALAVFAEADAIVSIDRSLLGSKAWRRIPILSPDEFISRYERA